MVRPNLQKQTLRKSSYLLRKERMITFFDQDRKTFFRHLEQLLVSSENCSIVSAFLAIGDEIDILPIMSSVRNWGIKFVLPVVNSENSPLTFREWWPGAPLVKGPLNTRHPDLSAHELEPDTLLVPFLAFDNDGYRWGWGGGYYDRTISKLRLKNNKLKVIGVGVQAQQVARVPRDQFDEPVDYIVTETAVIKPKKWSKVEN